LRSRRIWIRKNNPVRIISGKFKNRLIKFPQLPCVRPTREKVRKAVFDVLSGFVADKEVLDLFSGSGALGFEALSLGAKSVVFVESEPACQKIIKENIKALGVEAQATLITWDVFAALELFSRQKQKFSLVFADPPYQQELAKKCLLEIIKYDILHPFVIVGLEHDKSSEMPQSCGQLTLWRSKRYGDTFVSFFAQGIESA